MGLSYLRVFNPIDFVNDHNGGLAEGFFSGRWYLPHKSVLFLVDEVHNLMGVGICVVKHFGIRFKFGMHAFGPVQDNNTEKKMYCNIYLLHAH